MYANVESLNRILTRRVRSRSIAFTCSENSKNRYLYLGMILIWLVESNRIERIPLEKLTTLLAINLFDSLKRLLHPAPEASPLESNSATLVKSRMRIMSFRPFCSASNRNKVEDEGGEGGGGGGGKMAGTVEETYKGGRGGEKKGRRHGWDLRGGPHTHTSGERDRGGPSSYCNAEVSILAALSYSPRQQHDASAIVPSSTGSWQTCEAPLFLEFPYSRRRRRRRKKNRIKPERRLGTKNCKIFRYFKKGKNRMMEDGE